MCRSGGKKKQIGTIKGKVIVSARFDSIDLLLESLLILFLERS
jgi:hypothetical protein